MLLIMRPTCEDFQRVHDIAALLSRLGTPTVPRLEEPPLPAPRVCPARSALPVVLSVPHSGRDYPEWLLANARAGLTFLEDPRIDELIQPALARGVAAVIALASRAAIDCNRGEDEVDPRAVAGAPGPHGARAEAGLGLIASRSPLGGALWRRPIDLDALEQRLASAHRPFHTALAAKLGEAQRLHGHAVLIDCHSMPPRRRGLAQVVVGDRHGASAEAWVSDAALGVAQALGFSAALNAPFAGGHIVARHGQPGLGRHAIQVEVDRSLYCRADGYIPGPGVERVALLFDQLTATLGQLAIERSIREAAE